MFDMTRVSPTAELIILTEFQLIQKTLHLLSGHHDIISRMEHKDWYVHIWQQFLIDIPTVRLENQVDHVNVLVENPGDVVDIVVIRFQYFTASHWRPIRQSAHALKDSNVVNRQK